MKRLPFILLIVVTAIAFAFASDATHRTRTIYFNITTNGDTAEVVKFTPSAGIDSFAYVDSIQYQYDTSAFDTFTWVSPLQSMRVSVALDTAITYVCSLDLGTNIYGFEYDPSGNDDTTVALMIDNLVDSFNNVGGMSDTVTAHDSVSYIKLISQFAQIELDGDARWTAKVGDSLDTTSIWVTTVAIVCDSMVANINANASFDSFMTAYDSTTFYIVQSDDAGVDLYATTTDTCQTVAITQANVTSFSTTQDTLESVLTMMPAQFEVGGLDFWAILDSVATQTQGIGLSDSGYLWVWAVRHVAGNPQYLLLKADTCNSLPCSLHYQVTADTVGGGVDPDTLWREMLSLGYWLMDTASDTNSLLEHTLYIDAKRIGK